MKKSEYRAAMADVLYLAGCAVQKQVPDRQRIAETDLETLYQSAQNHKLAAITGMALESAGIKDIRFSKAILLAQRKNILLETDLAAVSAKLEEASIWHMPLKGTVLKDLYPRFGMREMADCDVLIDAEKAKDIRRIMESLGYQSEEFGCGIHDFYFKKPVSGFEMHRALFSKTGPAELYTYYIDVRNRLVRDEGKQFRFHFTDEDFYLYMIAHEYKHYSEGGTGLRSLLDTYVFLKSKHLDSAYIAQEAKKMGLSDFEEKNRALAFHVFEGAELTPEETERLDYMIFSGTYGTVENNAQNQIARKGRWGYFLSKFFLSRDEMIERFPVLEKAPVLFPVYRVWRVINGLIHYRKEYWARMKAILGMDGKKTDE